MPRLKLSVVLTCLILGLTSTAWSDDNLLQGKKLLEWGWDEPDTKFIRQNIAQMEQFPFDGLVFHANSSKGGGLTWEMWGSRKFTLDEVNQAMDDLKATNFERFTDRFLRVNVTPGKVDWFDDQEWATVLNNCGVAAQVAKQGRCKGFMFDAISSFVGGRAVMEPSGSGTPNSKNICSRPAGATGISSLDGLLLSFLNE
jgi:hypothetical protein